MSLRAHRPPSKTDTTKPINENENHPSIVSNLDPDPDDLEANVPELEKVVSFADRSGGSAVLPQRGSQRFLSKKTQRFCLSCSARALKWFGVFISVFFKPGVWLSKLVRMNLLPVILILFMVYFALILSFAGFIYFLANLTDDHGDPNLPNKRCLAGSGDRSPNWFQFMDVVTLSWTTFSTVGYGNVYPLSTSNTGAPDALCIVIGMLLSFEAFLGIIYASLAAGIVVGIISQQGSKAEVRFSSIIVIRERSPKGICRDTGPAFLALQDSEGSDDEEKSAHNSSVVDELSMDDFSYDADENREEVVRRGEHVSASPYTSSP